MSCISIKKSRKGFYGNQRVQLSMSVDLTWLMVSSPLSPRLGGADTSGEVWYLRILYLSVKVSLPTKRRPIEPPLAESINKQNKTPPYQLHFVLLTTQQWRSFHFALLSAITLSDFSNMPLCYPCLVMKQPPHALCLHSLFFSCYGFIILIAQQFVLVHRHFKLDYGQFGFLGLC